MTGVYKITSPTGKIYIGQSIDIERRLLNYKANRCANQKRLYHSLMKYGFNDHAFEVLKECEESELNSIERYYQDLFNSSGKNGLNCMLTGFGDRSGKHSQETINKMKYERPPLTQEARIKMSKAQKGRKHSEKTKSIMSKNNIGKVFSKHTLDKMSISAKNRGVHKAMLEKNRTIVLDLNTGVFYESITEAAIYKDLKYSTLKAKLNNQNFNNTSLIKV